MFDTKEGCKGETDKQEIYELCRRQQNEDTSKEINNYINVITL